MEIKKLDILPVNLNFNVSGDEALSPLNKPKGSYNLNIDLAIHRKREIQKEIERLSKDINQFLEKLNEILNPLNKELKVEIDQELNIPIFKIINKITNEVVRQIPLEEILKLMKNIEKLLEAQKLSKNHLKGLLLKVEV